MQAQIDAIEASLEGSRANILTRIRKDFEAAQRREALLATAYAAQTRLLSGKAEETAHYNLLKRDVDASRLLYETCCSGSRKPASPSALRANNIRIVDAAETPRTPYKPDVRSAVMSDCCLGWSSASASPSSASGPIARCRIRATSSYYLGLPELGVVPVGDADHRADRPRRRCRALGSGEAPDAPERPRARVEMISWRQKTSLLAESFRTTLTSILFSRRNGERPRVLVLTSASPKEGKTTVVSNLRIALAEINQRVLVIDADMRRPRGCISVFNVDNSSG